MASDVPATVQQFLRERIESYEQLETLLLLHRHPDRSWTGEAVAGELKLPPASAAAALDQLAAHRLLERPAGDAQSYRYAPGDAALGAGVQDLALACGQNLLGIVELMTRNAIERMRNSALRTFAEAFKLRGPGNG